MNTPKTFQGLRQGSVAHTLQTAPFIIKTVCSACLRLVILEKTGLTHCVGIYFEDNNPAENGLWHAVDAEGHILEVLVRSRRNKEATWKLLKGHDIGPRAMVPEKDQIRRSSRTRHHDQRERSGIQAHSFRRIPDNVCPSLAKRNEDITARIAVKAVSRLGSNLSDKIRTRFSRLRA